MEFKPRSARPKDCDCYVCKLIRDKPELSRTEQFMIILDGLQSAGLPVELKLRGEDVPLMGQPRRVDFGDFTKGITSIYALGMRDEDDPDKAYSVFFSAEDIAWLSPAILVGIGPDKNALTPEELSKLGL